MKELKLKYSIIIPTHNGEKTLTNAINSILIQKYKDYEIIVINDGSDNSVTQIINNIIENKRIKLIQLTERKKAGGARNLGIDIAKGEYIIFLDDDDILEENALENIDKVIKNKTPDIVYLGFKSKDENEEKIFLPNKSNSIKENRIKQWQFENVWDVCWNRNFLNKNNIKFVENKFFEDFLFYYKGIILSNTYEFLSKVTHIYTSNRKGSITTDISIEKLSDFYSNTSLLLEFIKNNNISKKYTVALLNGIIRNNNYMSELINKLNLKEE